MKGEIGLFSPNAADNVFFYGFSFYYAGSDVFKTAIFYPSANEGNTLLASTNAWFFLVSI
jgi:hypothetical protein